MGIENGLHHRREVTLLEGRTRMTKGHMGQALVCTNNLVLGILLGKQKYPYLPPARLYFEAHPAEALVLITRLYKNPVDNLAFAFVNSDSGVNLPAPRRKTT